MIRHSTVPVMLVAVIPALAACAGSDSSSGASVARDSAGIRIVASADSGSWTDASRPALTEVTRIGNVAGDANHELGIVTAVDIGLDGMIYVLDQTSGNIRAFDDSGQYRRTLSRRGTGPGEISRFAAAMIVTPGDTILVVDPARQLVVSMLADGTPVGDFPMPLEAGIPLKWGKRGDGGIVVQVRQFNLAAMQEGGATAGDTVSHPDQLQLRNAAGKIVDTLLTLPAGQTMRTSGSMQLFAPEPMWAIGGARGEKYFYGVNSEYSINEYDSDGALRRIIRRNVERVPVTDADKEAVFAGMAEQFIKMGLPGEMLTQMREMIGFASHYPAIGNLMGGPDGTLWVQRVVSGAAAREALRLDGPGQNVNVGSQTWDVYDNAGGLLGQVTMPDEFSPLQWVGHKLVGVQAGAGDVPNVVVFELRPARG